MSSTTIRRRALAVLAAALLLTGCSDTGAARDGKGAARITIDPAPIGQTRTGDQDRTPARAAFTPAAPGASARIEQQVDGSWKTVATGVQNKSGVFRAQLDLADADDGTAFRAVSSAGKDKARAVSAAVEAEPWKQVWADEFDGRGLDLDKWQHRLQKPGGLRLCSTPDESRVDVRGGAAVLSIAKVGPKTSACPEGVFHNGMIATGGVTSPGYTATHGVFAARVKFQSAQGMHGSFWLQGPKGTGAEIDVAEYFGDGRADGGFSNFVHYTSADDELSSAGGIRRIGGILPQGRTPAQDWHVYSVQWTPKEYVFRVDGVPTLRTSKPKVATAPEVLILSLLTSDYELPRLQDPASTMKVDWVRVWQE